MYVPGSVCESVDPVLKAVAVATSDVADQYPQRPPRYLFCTTSGNLKVDFWDQKGGAASLTLPVVAGQQYNWAVARVYTTGTTAVVVAMF